MITEDILLIVNLFRGFSGVEDDTIYQESTTLLLPEEASMSSKSVGEIGIKHMGAEEEGNLCE